MNVEELAAELGIEARDVIDRGVLAGFGLLSPGSVLSDDQIATLRGSGAQRALFGGSAPTGPGTGAGSGGDLSPGGHGFGGPLGFAPPGSEPPAGPPPDWVPGTPTIPTTPQTPSADSWDSSPSWVADVGAPLDPSTITIDSSGVHYGEEKKSELYQPPPPEVDLTRFREAPAPLPIPTADNSKLRTLAIGVVGLLVLIFGARFVGTKLNIIGPGAERHCILKTTPSEKGEGMVEELICKDGYGKVVTHEVKNPDSEEAGIEFGSTEDGVSTGIIDLDEFCRGANNFEDFRSGITDQIQSATSMGPVGTWYDEHDGQGSAGLGTMLTTFGNAGPNPQLNDLHQYLDDINEAVRSNSLPAAKMLLAATEQTHEAQLRALRTITNNQC